jgi:anaerobic ribonucleoside-triphosphate reductase
MGCRTRVIGNVYDPAKEICNGRGNLSFTTINLPRIAIKAKGDTVGIFFEELDRKIDLVIDQLLERFEIQARKKVKNFPFLMGQGVWLDSEKLGWNDEDTGGAQARHPYLRLHRTGRDAESPYRQAPRGKRAEPESGP